MRMHLAPQIDIYLQCLLHALKQLLFLIIGILAEYLLDLNACWSVPSHNSGVPSQPPNAQTALQARRLARRQYFCTARASNAA